VNNWLPNSAKHINKQERAAQTERIKLERDRATADQQKVLVKAEIEKEAAKHTKDRLQLLGEGEKLKLLEIAKGQKAKAAVIGKSATVQLAALEKAINGAVKNPDIVKVPTVLVNGSGAGGYEGAAAILRASNLIQAMKGVTAK